MRRDVAGRVGGWLLALVGLWPAVAQVPGSRPASVPECRIDGVVRDARGVPVASARVHLCRLRGEGLPAAALRVEEQAWYERTVCATGADGCFTLPVELGCLFGVWAEGPGGMTALHAPLVAGDRLELQLAPPVVVRGVVRSARGRPAPAVPVAVRMPLQAARPLVTGRGWLFPGPWLRGCADDHGGFALSVPQPPAGVPLVVEASSGAHRARDVVVDVAVPAELTLPAPTPPLRLRFVDAGRNPVAGVRIVSDWADGAEATSGPGGIAEVWDGLNAILRALPEVHATRTVHASAGRSGDQTIDVPLGEAVPLTGQLRADGKPLAGARLCFVSGLRHLDGDWARFLTTDGEGRFAVPGLERMATLRGYVERNGRFVPFVRLPHLERELDLGLLDVTGSGLLHGKVTGPDGTAIPGAELLVIPAVEEPLGPPRVRRVSRIPCDWLWLPVAADGRFCVADLAPGPCRIAVLAPGLPASFQQIQVGRGAQALDLPLAAGQNCSGVVLRHDGGFADQTTVTAMLDGAETADYAAFGLPAPTAVTDPSTGRFELRGMPGRGPRTLRAVRLPEERAEGTAVDPSQPVVLRLSGLRR